MNTREIKLIILGNSKAGKTSYILRYADNEFSFTISTTVGLDYKTKYETLENGDKVKICIFDTNGQERFKSISFNMLKNAEGVLLLYDITDRNSFDSIKGWMDSIFQYKDESFPIVLIGNKSDREDDRVVQTEEGENEAKKYNVKLFETSCKNNINISEPILYLISKVIKIEKSTNISIVGKSHHKNHKKCCKK